MNIQGTVHRRSAAIHSRLCKTPRAVISPAVQIEDRDIPTLQGLAEHFTSYKLDKATIANDLSSKERPPWILSAYGPGTRAPIQLFGGYPREQSFEELRLRHYELAIQGNHQTAIEEAQLLVNNAEQQIQAALNDVDGAIKYVINGENQHPNRIDMTNLKGNTPRQPQGLSQNQQTASFGGTTSGLSSAPITFGTPSGPTFGPPNLPPSNSAQSQTSTFGQPSSFGQPAALGRPTTSFGQPSSTFGKPSMVAPTFSQPSGPSPFSAPTNPSPFAPSSGTGANQQSSSTVNHASSILGQSSAPQANPFSQPAAPFQSNVFGRPSNPNPGNPFARPAQAGQDTSSAPNPFSQPTASTTAQSFGLPSTTASSSFGLPTQVSSSQNSKEKASGPSSGQLTNNGRTQQDAQGKLTSWNGKNVSYVDQDPCYKGQDGQWHRIWFPDGAPVFTKTPELPETTYGTQIRDDYRYLKEKGVFKGGIMPELPPRREWCNWNF